MSSRRIKRGPRQLSLAEARTRGGPRKGAGRKRKDPTARPNVVHGRDRRIGASCRFTSRCGGRKGCPGSGVSVSPRAVRNALVYVLANHIKHGEVDVGLLDPCSSGPWFSGWTHALEPPSEESPVEGGVRNSV